MKFIQPLFLLAALTASSVAAAPPGQIASPVETFAVPSPPANDPDRHFAGQRTGDDSLVLTASNGFFDTGIRAAGEASDKDAAGPEFITPDFAYLDRWTQPGLTARWHLWIATPGRLVVRTHLVTADAGSKLAFEIDGTTRTMVTRAESDPAIGQDPLEFTVRTAGWHTLTVKLEETKRDGVGQLHRIDLTGPAAVGSSLLRARWRPAACHARFSSSAVESPSLWVMSTRSSPDAAVSSYSPVTTPFGYYGCSFNEDGTSSGSANFSLWSFRRGASRTQDEWSHMLASGSPEGIFGSFGHEGSGVKLRGDWKPFVGQKEVTLALRREVARPWARWFSYYLDPTTQRFRLYAAAATWIGDSKRIASLNPGAFVEQPGPPDRQRSGDLLRDIHRRGWVLDDTQRWQSINTMTTGKASEIAAKHWQVTDDGWFSMGMGGMPRRPGPGTPIHLESHARPEWLNAGAIKDLHGLPAVLGKPLVTTTRSSARITIPVTELRLSPGETATVTLFHGPDDCLTFERDLGYEDNKTRFWPNRSEPQPVSDGSPAFELKNLPPGATQYFRVLVESPRGRIWSFETTALVTKD